jgi:hypothetical protein
MEWTRAQRTIDELYAWWVELEKKKNWVFARHSSASLPLSLAKFHIRTGR